MEWTEKQETQLASEEERLIKNEVLPVVTKSIEPALSQVERELVLVVDYVPGQALKVSLSRKRNLFDALEDVVEIKPDPEVEHRTNGPQKNKKDDIAPKSGLRVAMPDGSIIACKTATETFIRVIERIGVERVRTLGLKFCKVPIISNTRDAKYGTAQHPTSGGWLILTHSSTLAKKRQLDKISTALNLHLKVDIIPGE